MATYIPGLFQGSTLQDLAAFVQRELLTISEGLSEMSEIELRTVHVEPKKKREGMIVLADGTDWNPGAGIGVYVYVSGAWAKL